jgi:single-strand DNA-binding protein
MAELKLPSLNIVILSGRLTQDPELRFTPSGKPLTKFRMAVSRVFRGQTGEWQEETLFIDVTAWGDLAERCNQKLSKGSPVLVQGRLRSRNWETESGQKRSAIEVVARSVQFLEKMEIAESEESLAEETLQEGSPEEEDLPF